MILVAQSLWNESITQGLTQGALETLKKFNKTFECIQVPGALELPLAVKWAWAQAQRSQQNIEGVVACACIIKGDTYHFEIVANESARALIQLSIDLRIPIGNAVLACYNIDQAKLRSNPTDGKGVEAAKAVVEMLKLKEKMAY